LFGGVASAQEQRLNWEQLVPRVTARTKQFRVRAVRNEIIASFKLHNTQPQIVHLNNLFSEAVKLPRRERRITIIHRGHKTLISPRALFAMHMRLIDSPRTARACKCGANIGRVADRLNLFDDKRYLRADPALAAGCHPYLVNSVGRTPVKHSRAEVGWLVGPDGAHPTFCQQQMSPHAPADFYPLSCSPTPAWLINQNARTALGPTP